MLKDLFSLGTVLLVAVFVAGNAVTQETRTISGGTVINGTTVQYGELDSVFVDGGNFQNGLPGGFGEPKTIANITLNASAGNSSSNQQGSTVTGLVDVQGGGFDNVAGGTIGEFKLSNGNFGNSGTVTKGAVSGGNLNNRGTGVITTFTQSGGDVFNFGSIGEMTYNGGVYHNQGGSIRSLTLGSDATGVDFGTVNSLSFDTASGKGVVTINGYLGEDGRLTFDPGFRMNAVNLAGANLKLDFSDALTGNYTSFDAWTNEFVSTFDNGLSAWSVSWSTLFGVADEEFVADWDLISTISIGWDENQWTNIWQDGRAVNRMWDVNSFGVGSDAVVPEPATLAILGLGLAGLGFANRRRRK